MERVGSDGDWLVEQRRLAEAGEACWIERLAGFDLEQGWAVDGFLSCVHWAEARLGMSRSAAFEKLRLGRQMRLLPAMAESFKSGRISYSAARIISRLHEPSPEVEAAIVEVAETQSLRDVEHLVRAYELHREQELPPSERLEARRGVRTRRLRGGVTEISVTVSDLEAEEIQLAIKMFLCDRKESAAADRAHFSAHPDPEPEQESEPAPASEQGGCCEHKQSAAADSPACSEEEWLVEFQRRAEIEMRASAADRADALLEVVRAASACHPSERRGGSDRYLTHVVVTGEGPATLGDGTPIRDWEASKVACDTATVVHWRNEAGHTVSLGRKTREWSTPQRRAALARDGGCRFPGCGRTNADLHHQRYWEAGGPTDLDNGLLLCEHHHTIVHRDNIAITGNPDHTLVFDRADGIEIGRSHPIRRDGLVAV